MSNKILSILLVVMIVVVGVIGYLVYGAYQEYTGGDVDLSEASSIDGDTVTSEYYDSMVAIMVEYKNFLTTVKEQLENTDKVKSDAEKYLTFAVTERVEPSTTEEYDIDEYFFKFLSNSKSSAEYYIKFTKESDTFYLDLANDYMRDALDDINITGSILNKYGYE